MPMTSKRVRYTEDEWGAAEIAGRRRGMSAAEVARIGTISYSAFILFDERDEVTDAFRELFAAAERLARVYPLREP